ncbi:putative N-acetylmannosamine-6-phosphate 2-epimerase [uncultured Roseobacter sp.]|uniref:putative N-acetylmannosamine-6-phosphate 2-epimerase n=1 Tax=uncultured Roseobacter sp. TaxID=114847 RepID=UPI00260161CB|nr:putative N-acetylmannosamine-6-phosphate 2-epimerase [uncultured Roseobacter sp.]
MHQILKQLSQGLVVSCQPVSNGPLDQPDIAARFALAALAGGACGLRIEGADNLRAVRDVADVPIIGLIKSDRPDTAVRITSTIEDVNAMARAGADIIAFDATDRVRPVSCEALANAIHGHGKLAMADCSNCDEMHEAARLGCALLGTTMAGYVDASVPSEPDIALVRSAAKLGKFVVAEGRYNRPDLAAQAVAAGADAVVVGSAITRPEHITSWFARDIHAAIARRDGKQ